MGKPRAAALGTGAGATVGALNGRHLSSLLNETDSFDDFGIAHTGLRM